MRELPLTHKSDPTLTPAGSGGPRIVAPESVTLDTAFTFSASLPNDTTSTDYTDVEVSFSTSPSSAMLFGVPSNCTLLTPTSAPAAAILFSTAFSTLPAGYQLNLTGLQASAGSTGYIDLVVSLHSSDIVGGVLSWSRTIDVT